MNKGLVLAILCVVLGGCSHDAKPDAVTSSTSPSSSSSSTTSQLSGYLPLAVVAPSGSPSCREAVAKDDPAVLLGAFRAARLRHSGAEGCVTRAALANFYDAGCDETALASSPGTVVLYACGQHRLTAIPDNFEVARSDAHYVQFEVELSGVNSFGNPIRLYEHVSIGPGVPVGSQAEATQVILEDLPI